jgi:GH25 family lysozyme M1 (1,4-beta-N-acetylmuramidase)
MWQYTDSGQVAGIVGNVDLDLDLSAARPEGR